MAIARTSHLIGSISGTLGSVVFAQTRMGLLIKNRPLKNNQRSEKQLERRALFQRALSRWSKISGTQQKAWNTAAANFPQTNRLGVRSAISGWQLFIKQNLFTLWVEDTFRDDPVPARQTYAAEYFELSFTAGGEYLVSVGGFIPKPIRTVLYGARSFRSMDRAQWTPNIWTFFKFQTFTVQTRDVTAAWDAAIGPPQQDELIAVKVRIFSIDTIWPPGPPRTAVTQML